MNQQSTPSSPPADEAASPFFSPEQLMLRDSIRRFVDEEIKPHADAWEKAGFVPRELLKKMGSQGYFGIRYPEEYGGADMNTMGTIILAEELGRSTYSGVAITALVHTDMASVHIFNAGTPAQKARWMPPIVAGETITAVAITEPDAGSDVKGIRTSAKRKDGGYVLNGAKLYITNGVHADLYCVAAKTGGADSSQSASQSASKSVTMFLVEKGTPGFRVARQLDKHGWRSSDTAELVFENCFVPEDAVLGEEGSGFYAIMKNFQNERLVLGAMAIGESQAALDLTVEYVKTRKAFGAPLFDKQAIRQRLAMLSARVEAGRQLIYNTAWRDAAGHNVIKEVSMAKAYCGELVNEVMYGCLQFHGGFGYMREATIERMTRDARVQSIGGGATEVMLEEIAKRL